MDWNDLTLKKQFAANWLRYPDNPMKAAFETVVRAQDALPMGTNWPNDAEVIALRDQLAAGPDAKQFLPTKELQARDIYAIAQGQRIDAEARLKAHRLYAEIMGFIEKPSTNGAINILNQGVMIVPVAANDSDWEERARKQQSALIGDVRVN